MFKNLKIQNSSARDLIAIVVISIWIGIAAIAAIVFLLGGLGYIDLKDFLQLWHDRFTWIVTLVLGYYFGSSSSNPRSG